MTWWVIVCVRRADSGVNPGVQRSGTPGDRKFKIYDLPAKRAAAVGTPTSGECGFINDRFLRAIAHSAGSVPFFTTDPWG